MLPVQQDRKERRVPRDFKAHKASQALPDLQDRKELQAPVYRDPLVPLDQPALEALQVLSATPGLKVRQDRKDHQQIHRRCQLEQR